jgi:predicted small metal-binding protein
MFVLRCRDLGFDCAGVISGTTRQKVFRQASEHATKVHGTHATPALAQKVAALIRVEAPAVAPH